MSAKVPDYGPGLNMVRMLRMLQQSHRRALPVAALAEDLGVNERTIKRYADALAEGVDSGPAPLVQRVRRGGRAWIQLPSQRAELDVSLYQFAATWMATRVLRGRDGNLLSDGVDDVLERLPTPRRMSPLDVARRIQQSFYYVPFGPKGYRDCEDALDIILRATLNRRRVALTYRRLDGTTSRREAEPFTLVLYRDGLYALARAVEDRDGPMRLFALDRMQDVEQLTEGFKVPRGFDPDEHFRACFGVWRVDDEPADVRLAFCGGAADTVRERTWPGLQGFEPLADGRTVLHLRVPINPELVTWVCAWASHCEVLGPDGLRERVVAELRGALARYDQPALGVA